MDVEPVEVATGTVAAWSDEEGWGAITSADVPGEVFAHYSAIIGVHGYRSLAPGQQVRFTWERCSQDGFAFRAIDVFVGDDLSPGAEGHAGQSDDGAYRSHLLIRFDDQQE